MEIFNKISQDPMPQIRK